MTVCFRNIGENCEGDEYIEHIRCKGLVCHIFTILVEYMRVKNVIDKIEKYDIL
ncbi:MAG: hypothetical protein K2J04_11645 [Lachnospiraceae bacterium]|nr:hypothetical protein [Lachnospiraceae bacterium]